MTVPRPNVRFSLRSKSCAFVFLALGFSLFSTPGLNAQKIYGIAGGTNLVTFDAATPGVISSMFPVTGVTAGQTIAGLDMRPLNNQLYLLGYNSTSGQAQIYVLDTVGSATPVGAAAMLGAGLSNFGFDFNPTVDRLRVTSSSGANFRMHPGTGALVATDGNLAFAGTDVNSAASANVVGVAYTNSFIGSTSTTLFNYDASLNVLTTQIPPNAGTLNTVGASGIALNPADPSGDLDIWFDPAAGGNVAFLAANVGSSTADNLYKIDLTTGAATLVGGIGGGLDVQDIAVAIQRGTAPPFSGRLGFALTSNNNLISFDLENPGFIRTLDPVSGVATGQALVGLDSRPATGQLYAMGYNSTSGQGQLYVLDTVSAAATAVGSTFTLDAGLTNVSFDFNPTVDRIRVVSGTDKNYRLHPITGALVATDGNLAFAAGDPNASLNPSVVGAAYSNSYIASTATTLFDFDQTGILTTQVPPNAGTLNTVGTSGLALNATDPSADLDIFFDETAGTNIAYLAANTGSGTFDFLYKIDLTNGAILGAGAKIGNGIAVNDITAAIGAPVLSPVTGRLFYGLTTNGLLISFDSQNPSEIRSATPVTGLAAGQLPLGLDSRPATGELYLMGYNSATGETQFYVLNKQTGAATAVAPAVVTAMNLGEPSIDFNPTVDRIRLTGSNNQNFRLHPATGALAATDGNLAYAAGDPNAGADPAIGAGGYTNNFVGAASTVLFDYDDVLNVLSRQVPPNAGTLNTVGASGITVNPASPSSDLDIVFDAATSSDRAFLSANVGTSNFDNLYSLNLSTGAATSLGKIGNGVGVYAIAGALDAPPCTITNLMVQKTDLTCPSASNGSIVITATAPGTTLEYSVNGGASFQLSGTFSNLGVGTYNVVVRTQGNAACSQTSSTTLSASQSNVVFNGNLTFTSQAQVDAANPCLTVVNGNLIIQNFTVKNLSALQNLRKVTGNLTIKLTQLDSVPGLKNLDTVGGKLTINNNPLMSSLKGLEGLTVLGKDLRIFYNHKLKNCCPIYDLLNSPGAVGGSVGIFFNGVGCDNLANLNAACDGNFTGGGGGAELLLDPSENDGQAMPEQQIFLSPNPASGTFTAEINDDAGGEFLLFDLAGKVVLRQMVEAGSAAAEVSVEGLQPGLYLARWRTANGVFTGKISVE